MSGSSLTTKGLVSGGGTSPAPAQTLPPAPPGPLPLETATPSNDVTIIVPTAINFVLMVAENITENLRAQQSSDLTLPSLYKRAFLVVNETDEIAIVRQT